MLETSWADAHKSEVSMQHNTNNPTTSTLCVYLHRPRAPRKLYSQISLTPALGHHGPLGAPAVEDASQAPSKDLSPLPLPVFEISTQNRFPPLCKTEHNAMIVGGICATLAKG